MKAAIFINTPAQFHFWRPIAAELEARGHSVQLLVRDYGETRALVEETGIDCWIYSRPPSSKLGKIAGLPRDVLRAWRHLRRDKPDVLAGFGIYEAFVGRLLRRPAVTFTDSEPSCNRRGFALQFRAYLPFVEKVVTPHWFKDDLGSKHVRVRSLKELAYLHPDRRTRTQGPPSSLGVVNGERYAVVRLNAFDAVHDAGIRGFTLDDLHSLVDRLTQHVRVFISAEGELASELAQHRLPTPKSAIHAVLEHATVLVTDTQTMATEAVLLGTPTVRCNDFVGPQDMGVFPHLAAETGLLWNVPSAREGTDIAAALASNKRRPPRRAAMKGLEDIVPFMADALVDAGGPSGTLTA